MSLTRRGLSEKSLAFGAATFLSALAGQANLLTFTHVTVVDAAGQPALCAHTVIVAGDRIQEVVRSCEMKLPKGVKVIHASGKYMTPDNLCRQD